MQSEYTELYTEFLAFEEDLDLFSFEIDGVSIWERVRFVFFEEIAQKRGLWSQPISGVEKNVTNVLKGSFLFLKNLVRRNPFLSSEHDVMFVSMGRRKRMDDGHWWDIYCDPIYDAVDMDYVHLEPPYMNDHQRPVKTGNIRYLDLIEYSSTAVRELNLVTHDLSAATRRRCRRIQEEIRRRFDVEVDIESEIRFRMSLDRSLGPMYSRLVDRVNPEIAVVVPSILRHVFIDVCKRKGVPVVELQHGALSDYEYGYPGDRDRRTAPDYFFSWGDFWNDKVALPVPDENVKSVGYPYFQRQLERFTPRGGAPRVLFLSQGNVGKALSKVAVEFSETSALDSSNVLYKLHPGEYDRWESDYPWLTDADLEVIDDGGTELYQLFADASAQVGVYSTALFEGLGFELDTFLVDLPGVELVSELYEDDHATLVSSAADLDAALAGDRRAKVDPTEFFASDPIKNFSDEVDGLLS